MPQMTNRNIVIAIIALIVLGLIVFYFPSQNDSETDNKEDEKKTQATNTATKNPPPPPPASAGFNQTKYTETKAKGFASSTPANNALLKSAPDQVSIKFNSNLAAGSTITVVSDKGVDVVPSGPRLTTDLRTLYIPVEIAAAGNYKVNYKACLADGSCSDGTFGFSVDLAK